jgi:hypothetical protein
LPKQVNFKSGPIISWPEKAVAENIRRGINNGQIFFGVSRTFSGPRFEVYRMQRQDGEGAGSVVLMALFTGNFKARCNADGVEPKNSLKECLKKVIYEDMKINAEKIERGSYHSSETVGLIGLVKFRIVEK